MTNYLLIDGNSVGFSAQFGNNLSYKDNPTQAIFGVMRTVRRRMATHEGYVPIVFWDGKSWRYEAYEGYKAGRDDDEKMREEREQYKAQRPSISRVLRSLGVMQVAAKNQEADDMIARHVASLLPEDNAIILSGDRDLLQLVRENVVWTNPITRIKNKPVKLKRVDLEAFPETMGYETPADFLVGKLMLGDSSDKLGSIKGLGDKAVPLVVKHWNGSIKNMILDVRKNGKDAVPASLSRYRKKILDFCNDPAEIKRITRDMGLMQLLDVSKIPAPVGTVVTYRPLNKADFQAHCEKFGFESVLREFDDFIAPFEAIESHSTAAHITMTQEEKEAA